MFLFERQGDKETERETEENLPSTGSLPDLNAFYSQRWPRQKSEAENSVWVSYMGDHLLPPQKHISRKLNQKTSIWDVSQSLPNEMWASQVAT